MCHAGVFLQKRSLTCSCFTLFELTYTCNDNLFSPPPPFSVKFYCLPCIHTHSHVQPTTAHDHTQPQYKFVDLPYTEWISQRWTYNADAPFSNWPSLPPTIKEIQQVTSGSLSYRNGVWLLTDSELVFVDNLKSHNPTDVKFYNVTEELDIEIQLGSRVVTVNNGRLFLVTIEAVFLLDCSQMTDENPYVYMHVNIQFFCKNTHNDLHVVTLYMYMYKLGFAFSLSAMYSATHCSNALQF